ncbi:MULTISPECIES: helix-turn-helix domain-containing protein [Flavobacteriaceae]|uniref:helix-turn-helix domain-containing protein n=1 Tax=Flavobacteriaceae TaxID=49546 RepID=UPI002349B780|nr:helix-turn-helix transcriptional regulator [Muricauda sp. SP22]MDC6363432.1 helix-turn-helix transcriptional regulator [Muricauda sp. SP22]
MNNDIIPRIQSIMEHYGLTVSAFADEIGVQRSSISHLLNGRNKPSLDFVIKLVDAYPSVNLYWLLMGIGNFPSETESGKEIPAAPSLKVANLDMDEPKKRVSKDENRSQVPSKIVVFYEDGTFESFLPKND